MQIGKTEEKRGEMMKRIMGKDKSGFIGEWDEGILTNLFTGEAKDTERENITEVGFIDPPTYFNSLSGQLFKHQMMGTTVKPFYLLGNVSARQKLRYVRMNNTVLMGFADHHAGGNGNIYFFSHCGEVEGVPVFTYASDMVVKEEEIIWVHEMEHTHVPNQVR